jgi:predicted small lipoprotein YifL
MRRWTLDRRLAAAALLAVGAFALGSCGKRGFLETPPPLYGDRAQAGYQADQQQRAQDAADSRARSGNNTAAADQSDDGPPSTRDVKSPEQKMTPASRAPIDGAPNPLGPPINPTPPDQS